MAGCAEIYVRIPGDLIGQKYSWVCSCLFLPACLTNCVFCSLMVNFYSVFFVLPSCVLSTNFLFFLLFLLL